ncbi:MAG: 3-dehydroquinate synthase [Desulfomicrobiaceae bacterium]|jgi:3-dehydroquinate synthase II|nr:3-dehydroquinate synthase [Desulfomicrobiaceae bacterium]MDK2873701.1 3-dehydroquinate synthase [Desulfomicrobiaceae bacterium]
MRIYFAALPFCKDEVALALESGVDGVITDAEHVPAVQSLAKGVVLDAADLLWVTLASKEDEETAVTQALAGKTVVLRAGFEIIPVENILAQTREVLAEVESAERARVAAGILECGVAGVVVRPEAAAELKTIIAELRERLGQEPLVAATITAVEDAGLGHRVCVDTTSLFTTGMGLLVGNSSAFTFLVHAETESNPYVAPRPFRINAGAVHSYCVMPEDRTRYLEELRPGDALMVVHADGHTQRATVGRVKTEIRPMLRIDAEADGQRGTIFLQNAETIRLTRPDGTPVSVVQLTPGDQVLCRLDAAGRHFGMRISEDIRE